MTLICKKCKHKVKMIGEPGPDGAVILCETCKEYRAYVPYEEHMMNIEKLRELVQRLDRILDDPQPGLSTWREAVNKLIFQINQHGG